MSLSEPGRAGHAFGTFKGVFTPSILTILGVVMYLRFPWVLGSVGLPATIVIVTLSVAITAFTGLSIAAMATNMRVGGGGAYYMISRTLGVEVGAAVGLPLFLAQALGIAFYIVGFAETVVAYFPTWSPILVGIVALFAMAALAYRSADLALKSQFAILAVLGLSLISLFMGHAPDSAAPTLGTGLPAAGFWVAFAVFFPAVTGIEAGLGLSGDLKNPARSLPLGTLAAVATGYAIYLAIPTFLAYVVTDESLLLGDSLLVTRVSRWPVLVLLGIMGASLSSAMGALLGAPRTLQALADDAVLPKILGRGFGANHEPRLATLVAFGIAFTGIVLGDLNAIAPVLSMFFLTSYAVLNLSAGLEGLIGGPAWRPTFRVPWWISMLGFVACISAMLMISAGATILAMLVTLMVYFTVHRRQLGARWGDVKYGILVLIVRLALNAMARRKPHARSWSPNVLVLTGVPTARWHLVVIARALAGESGLLTVAAVIPETADNQNDRIDRIRGAIKQHLVANQVPAFVKIATDADVGDGLIALVKSYGFGPLVPNTVLLGKSVTPQDAVKHAALLAVVQRRHRNLIIVHEGEELTDVTAARRIDIWWSGHRDNMGLMLALVFLLRKNEIWVRSDVVVWNVVRSPELIAPTAARLEETLAESRFSAKVRVVCEAGDPIDAVRRHSSRSDLVFLGLRGIAPDESPEAYASYYAGLTRQTEGFPPTVLVCAGEPVELHRLFAGG